MARPNVTFLYNNSLNETENTGGAAGDSNFKPLNPVLDKIAFLGSGTNNDDPNTSKDIFVIPESGSKEPPRICINDYSESKWKRVYLGGSDADEGEGGNYRYAFGAYISGETASAPILQAWDSTTHNSYDLEVLGGGTPDNSMLRGISTTDSTSGIEWSGTPLAGSGGGNSLALSDAAIPSAQMIYWNMRLLVPYSANPFAVEPIICLYFTYS